MVRVLAYEAEGPGFNSRPCLKLLKCKIELCIQNNNNNKNNKNNNNNNNNNNSHHLLGWRWRFSQNSVQEGTKWPFGLTPSWNLKKTYAGDTYTNFQNFIFKIF